MKRMTALILVVLTLFSLAPSALATGGGREFRESTPRLEELIRAVELGFGTDVDDESTITYAEYYDMLETLVELVAARDGLRGAETLSAWTAKYAQACNSSNNEPLNRLHAVYMLYTLAWDVLGEVYSARESHFSNPWQNYMHLHMYMGDGGSFDLVWPRDGSPSNFNSGYFGDYDRNTRWPDDNTTHFAAAYFYSLGRTSMSGWPLFEYDETSNSLRLLDGLTKQEAMLSVLRMYESVDPFEMEVGFNENMKSITDDVVKTYRKDIITDELLQRADYMPTPTMESLPYYTGVHHDWLLPTSDLNESAFRAYAEMGFNYVRLDLGCKNFFGVGDEITSVSQVPIYETTGLPYFSNESTAINTVDMACLTRLDQAISWGLKYGLHICAHFSDYPGHNQFTLEDGATADWDFYWNETKQQQTALMYTTIAERYKDIPNSVLSFIVNHEPTNSSRTTGIQSPVATREQITAAAVLVTNAIRAVDDERFLFCQSTYDQCIDAYMTDSQLTAPLGLAQVSNYAANEFAYGIVGHCKGVI